MSEDTISPHECALTDRARLTLTGVSEVRSFNETQICLHTSAGALTVDGERLFIDRLDLESGRVCIAGRICALSYEDQPQPPGSWLSRIFL